MSKRQKIERVSGPPLPHTKHNILESELDNTYVASGAELPCPDDFIKSFNITTDIKNIITTARRTINDIINGRDKRLLLIIGPCSIHNINDAYIYAQALNEIREAYKDKFYIVMRTYFEKPRTTTGWKGLISDPNLNETYDINKGIEISRKFLIRVLALGLPIACELLEIITPLYLQDLFCYGCIGARTTESQIHRQMASGVSCAMGFKNNTSGEIDNAINSITFSKLPHTFIGLSKMGKISIIKTKGNKNCHIILRGGKSGTNYDMDSVKNVVEKLNKKNENNKILIDCSHDNSNKSYKEQINVINKIANNFKNDINAKKYIFGLMIESYLNSGNQKLDINNIANLKSGLSITDECISLNETMNILENLYNQY